MLCYAMLRCSIVVARGRIVKGDPLLVWSSADEESDQRSWAWIFLPNIDQRTTEMQPSPPLGSAAQSEIVMIKVVRGCVCVCYT